MFQETVKQNSERLTATPGEDLVQRDQVEGHPLHSECLAEPETQAGD